MANKPHKNKLLRVRKVCDIVEQHYEEGNLAKCYKQVWRHHVFPVYPMCYHTFLSYLHLGGILAAPPEPPQQPSLFDIID